MIFGIFTLEPKKMDGLKVVNPFEDVFLMYAGDYNLIKKAKTSIRCLEHFQVTERKDGTSFSLIDFFINSKELYIVDIKAIKYVNVLSLISENDKKIEFIKNVINNEPNEHIFNSISFNSKYGAITLNRAFISFGNAEILKKYLEWTF